MAHEYAKSTYVEYLTTIGAGDEISWGEIAVVLAMGETTLS